MRQVFVTNEATHMHSGEPCGCKSRVLNGNALEVGDNQPMPVYDSETDSFYVPTDASTVLNRGNDRTNEPIPMVDWDD